VSDTKRFHNRLWSCLR